MILPFPATAPISLSVALKVDVPTPLPDIGPSSVPPVTTLPKDSPLTLLRNETLAWNILKQVKKDEDIDICYNMFVKEFEQSTIHDLCKVLPFVHGHS